MSRVPIAIKRAALALAMAGGLIAGAAIALRVADPAPSARAAPGHALMNAVAIHNFSFGPTALTVPVGTKVVWTNNDDDPHTVTSDTDATPLKSPPLDTGESFAFTFDKPGTYRYFCTLHPHMRGTVVVQ